MGFRKEVRDFMAITRAEHSVIQQQDGIISDLRKQNAALMNRLMATDFKELQTYTLPEEVETAFDDAAGVMDFTNEELAGEIVDVEGAGNE